MPDSTTRFVAVGDVMVDVVCLEMPSAGARVHADVSVRVGGSAVNAAAAAAAARASATVIGRVGNDSAGDLVVAELEALEIAVNLARDPDPPGVLSPVIAAYSRRARRYQNRPVTPEVAGSSPVAPVAFEAVFAPR